MKILYGAGNRLGANIQLEYFLKNSTHEIYSAAYLRGSEKLPHINWILDALKPDKRYTNKEISRVFNHSNVPQVNVDIAKQFVKDVAQEAPDLVISDAEPITAHLAYTLELPLWYCSPLHLLDGIEWEESNVKYWTYLRKIKYWLQKFPVANRYLICSPFGDINMRPFLKEGFEWVKPYYPAHHNIYEGKDVKSKDMIRSFLSSYNMICNTGETGYIASGFYNNKSMCIIPMLDNPESMLNTLLCEQYNIGVDLGQVDTSIEYLKKRLQFSVEKDLDRNYLNEQNRKYLHEVK